MFDLGRTTYERRACHWRRREEAAGAAAHDMMDGGFAEGERLA